MYVHMLVRVDQQCSINIRYEEQVEAPTYVKKWQFETTWARACDRVPRILTRSLI
jgi:hypothetical protein